MESISVPAVFEGDYVPKHMLNIETRTKFIAEFLPKSKSYLLMSEGREIRYAEGNEGDKWYFLLTDDKTDVIYYMHLCKLNLHISPSLTGLVPKSFLHPPKPNSVYQGSVWTNTLFSDLSAAVARTVFAKIFKSLGLIYSDTQQSHEGKRFWRNQIDVALQVPGLLVFAAHIKYSSDQRLGTITQLVPIRSLHDVNKRPYYTYEKDKDDEGLNWRMVLLKE